MLTVKVNSAKKLIFLLISTLCILKALSASNSSAAEPPSTDDPDTSPPPASTSAPVTFPPSLTASPSLPGGLRVRWCTVSADEFTFCNQVVPELSVAGSQDWGCVLQSSPSACMDAIGRGEADLISLDSGIAFYAFLIKSMKAVAAERVDKGLHFDAVAVVREELCDINPELRLVDLKGMRSCHGAYLSASGWSLPLTALMESNAIATPGDDDSKSDVDLVSDFFLVSCAPGDRDSDGWRVCSGCYSDGAASSCDVVDPFYGPTGSLRCLLEDAADVAFTRTPVVTKYSRGGVFEQSWSSLPASELRFLCPGGGCQPVTDNPSYSNCTLGQVATNVIMTRNAISETDKQAIAGRLHAAGTVDKWTKAMYEGNNPQGYLLTSSAVGLVSVENLTRAWLGSTGQKADAVLQLKELTTGSDTDSQSSAGVSLTSMHLLSGVVFLIHFITILHL